MTAIDYGIVVRQSRQQKRDEWRAGCFSPPGTLVIPGAPGIIVLLDAQENKSQEYAKLVLDDAPENVVLEARLLRRIKQANAKRAIYNVTLSGPTTGGLGCASEGVCAACPGEYSFERNSVLEGKRESGAVEMVHPHRVPK